MPDQRRSPLRLPKATLAAGSDLAASIRDSFRQVKPEDVVETVREGPVRAIRDIEPSAVMENATSARDAVLEAVAAVVQEVARDPKVVPAALARLPAAMADRLPAPVVDRLPAAVAERIPSVRRRRRQRLIVGGIIVAAVATAIAVVVVARRRRRHRVLAGPATDRMHTHGVEGSHGGAGAAIAESAETLAEAVGSAGHVEPAEAVAETVESVEDEVVEQTAELDEGRPTD